MGKTVTITLVLVEEADLVPNEQIEQEIHSHLNQLLNGLPWQKTVKNIKVAETATATKQAAPVAVEFQVFDSEKIPL
ncbi:MAG: hypothetical protein ACQCN3_00615 [Candidatus Bathyarchaeia archaeon]|jgi:hypothetical protein